MTTPLDPGAITGTTAGQMRDAPNGATYVIHHMRALGYFKALAAALGRTDLLFTSLVSFGPDGGFRAKADPIIVDHYADKTATPFQRAMIATYQQRNQQP